MQNLTMTQSHVLRHERYNQLRRLNNPYGGGTTPWSSSGWGIFDSESDSPSVSKGEKAVIKLRDSHKPNQIKGTVQLAKETTHTGLLIDLQGYFQPSNQSEPVVNLLSERGPAASSSPNFQVCHRFCGGAPGAIISSPVFRKYLFDLELPQDILPSFSSPQIGKVKYQLRVWMQFNSRYILLSKKTIQYLGQFTIFPETTPTEEGVSQEIVDAGVKAVLQLPRKEFLRNENIHFNLKIWDQSKLAVKKVEVILWRRISCVRRNNPSQGELRGDDIGSESSVIDSVTFKRFLRREVISRRGKFSGSKISLPTFIGEQLPKLKIKYWAQINITTQTSTISTQVDIIIGTNRVVVSNPLDANLEGSMLSLFPPGYSTLSSRAGSTFSLETLPPHYEDLLGN